MGRAFEYRKAAKMKRWGMMSRVFPRLAKKIQIAAKEGGSDPDVNSALRTAIQNAKAANMPKDNIDAAIKRATSKDSASFIELNYEGKGPHGVLVFVECATDNTTRTVANVKSYFNKVGGQIVNSGSLEFMFDRKAIIEIPFNDEVDIEELELELIDFGLEEIEVDEDLLILSAPYTSFGELTKAIEDKEIEIKKAHLQRIPNSPVEFSKDQLAEIEPLLEKLEEDDDVQEVFTNIA